MLIISRKKLNKIKKEFESKSVRLEFTKVIIKAIDGIFLFDLTKNPFYENRCTPIENEMPGLEVSDCSHCYIEDIIVAGNGKQEPVIITMSIPYAERIAEGYFSKPDRPYEDFTNDELKEIIEHCEVE